MTVGVLPILQRGLEIPVPSVCCAGGSWLTPAALLDEARWNQIPALSRAAAKLPVARAGAQQWVVSGG